MPKVLVLTRDEINCSDVKMVDCFCVYLFNGLVGVGVDVEEVCDSYIS